MKTFFVHLIMFFYIYSVSFVFLPISTRVLFGFFGFVLFSLNVIKNSSMVKINSSILGFLFLLFSIGLVSIVSIVMNGTTDIEFVKYVISILTMVFASYFVIIMLNKLDFNVGFTTLSAVIVNIILLQSLIALIMFLVHPLMDFLVSIQSISSKDVDKLADITEFRIIGFGTYFFAAGVINGFGLILIGYMVSINTYTKKKLCYLTLKFLIICVVGMMMARTAIIGGVFGVLLIFMPKDFRPTLSLCSKRLLFLLYIILIPITIALIILLVFPKVVDALSPLFNFAFEMFINYFDKGSLESASTNQLGNMYILPNNLATWFIGDGLWSDPNGSGYYMHTDVGFLRLIYYFGMPGIIVFLATQYYLLMNIFKHYAIDVVVIIMFFLYLLILNLKGFTDLFPFFLIYFVSISSKNRVFLKGK